MDARFNPVDLVLPGVVPFIEWRRAQMYPCDLHVEPEPITSKIKDK